MALKKSLVYTLLMLFLMVVAGIVGAAFGNALGRDALKGVTQPDFGLSSRTNRKTNEPEPPLGQSIAFLSEAKILDQTKARRSGPKTVVTPPQSKPTPTPEDNNTDPKNPTAQTGFPVVSQDGGVLMEVTGARPEDGSLVLQVSLRNQGTKAVRFLYSFLDVTDNQGRALSATAEGLPGELLPLSDTFSGTVRIPQALLEGVDQISIALTDYPDQKLKLKLTGIPVLKNVAQ